MIFQDAVDKLNGMFQGASFYDIEGCMSQTMKNSITTNGYNVITFSKDECEEIKLLLNQISESVDQWEFDVDYYRKLTEVVSTIRTVTSGNYCSDIIHEIVYRFLNKEMNMNFSIKLTDPMTAKDIYIIEINSSIHLVYNIYLTCKASIVFPNIRYCMKRDNTLIFTNSHGGTIICGEFYNDYNDYRYDNRNIMLHTYMPNKYVSFNGSFTSHYNNNDHFRDTQLSYIGWLNEEYYYLRVLLECGRRSLESSLSKLPLDMFNLIMYWSF